MLHVPGDVEVSVVMSVCNDARYVAKSIESLLGQEGVSFELIIVDDGSRDETPEILARFANADPRIRVIRQENQGLTRALIRASGESRGTYLARQDADDVSLPGRLRKQADLLDREPSVRLVGCWIRHIGPLGEDLGTWQPSADAFEATRGLRCGDIKRIRSLGAHGSAMFRRHDYSAVGGYRQEFYFAQDLDLWLRLTELGMLAIVPQVLYEWRMSPLSITGRFRSLQMRTARVILSLARVREEGGDEGPLLREAALIRPSDPRGKRLAPGLYFIGKRLLDRKDPRAIGYLKAATAARPWHIKSWIFLALAVAMRTVWRRS